MIKINYLKRLPKYAQYKGNYKKNEIEILGSDDAIIYEDKYIVVINDKVKFPSGKESKYLRIFWKAELENQYVGAAVLPIYQNKILLNNIFRHTTRSYQLEIPRGFGEKGETQEITAIREVEEETGLTVKTIKRIGSVHPDTGILTNKVQIYKCELKNAKTKHEKEETEVMKNYQLFELKELEEKIKKEEITDSFTISAIFMYKLKK